MPGHRQRLVGTAALVLALAGCMPAGGPDAGASRSDAAPAAPGAAEPAAPAAAPALIEDLRARRSILPAGGSAARIAGAVLAAGQGAGAAELRVARLKAEARARNWLPSIGPSVDLSSLGAIAAGLLVQQAVFDHGRRRAERAFAAADVEVAAVDLSRELNARVHDGLARAAEAQAATARRAAVLDALAALDEPARIIRGRVAGGVADAAEARRLDQTLAELQALADAEAEAAETARAALAQLAGGPVAGADALGPLSLPAGAGPVPLSVLRVQAEGRRSVAEAQVARAGHLPGLGVGATLGPDGLQAGARVGADKLLGLGTRADLAALQAAEAVAADRAAEAADDARRERGALERQIAELQAREGRNRGLLGQLDDSVTLYAEQATAGVRPYGDVIALADQRARLAHETAGLPFEMLLLQLRIAQDLGLLAEGTAL
jgi:adhesin transport system outer membrane protein